MSAHWKHAKPDAPLEGLMAERPGLRKKMYYTYAGLALLVSLGPDVIMAGLLTEEAGAKLTAVLVLASSALLKIGTAFGFVAASNISQDE